MKPFAVVLALLAGLAGVSPAPAEAASLRTHIVVEDDVIRLGDLFADAGPRANVAVAQAPAPGRRSTFELGWLAEIARAYQVAWRPQSRFDRAVVERAGKMIGQSEIMKSLSASLAANGMRRGDQIDLSNRNLDIAVPLSAPASVEVINLSYDSVSGRFNATLAAGGEGPHAQRVSISGRTFRTISLPVLRGSVSPGDVIRRQDIEWLSIREDRVSRDVVTDANRLVGTTPRVRLRPGEPIRDNDTRPPVLVTRNSSVMIVLQMPNMTLTAQGRAIEDGAKGDVIRVTNLQSKKVIEATVNGPDMVTVIVGPRLSLN